MPVWLAGILEKLAWRAISALAARGWKAIKGFFAFKQQEAKDVQTTKKFDEVVTKPDTTREERQKSEDDFLNS